MPVLKNAGSFFKSKKTLQTITLDNMSFEIQDFDNKKCIPLQTAIYTFKTSFGN